MIHTLDLTAVAVTSRSIREATFPTLARHAKLTEEVGEFAEATLVALGYLKHKILKEGQAGELADVIICAVDTYLASNPDQTISTLMADLQDELIRKRNKWAGLYGLK